MAAILHSPFFEANNLNYANYAGLGTIVAHEIYHGFDQERRYAEDVDPQTKIEFSRQTDCIKEQYSNYTFKGDNVTFNVSLSVQCRIH